jgi:acylaminoacyl-peptidase
MFDESFIGLRDSYCSTASYAATPSTAVISDSGSCVRAEVVSSWRDLDENKMRNFVDSFELQGEYMVRTSIHSTEVLKPPISSISPSNLRKVTVKSVEKKQIIEISAFDVKKFCRIESSSIHGAPIGDSWFGGVSWSTDENYFTFIAKSKDPETVTAIGLDAIKNEKVSSSDSSASKLISSFEFVDDWGEKYESTSALSIVVVSVLDGKVKTVSGIDSKCFSVGQPVFLPSASESLKLAYTAWSIQYRKLGMIYCYHRPCSVFVVDVTDLFKSAESVNNNGNS